MKNYYELTCKGNCSLDEDRIYDLKTDDNIFISCIDGENITVAAALDEDEDIAAAMTDFMNKAELDCEGFEFDYITGEDFYTRKNDHIYIFREEDEEFNEELMKYPQSLSVPEDWSDTDTDADGNIFNFIMTVKAEHLFKDEAKRLAAESDLFEDFSKEIERIYTESENPFALGHPVHYYIETERDDLTDVRTLLNALFTNRRLIQNRCYYLFSSRFYGLNGKIDRRYSEIFYKKARGGAVIIDIRDEDDITVINEILNIAELNANRVLTVFCGPKYKSEKLKKLISENTWNIEILPICASGLSGKRAEDFLLECAAEFGLEADNDLMRRARMMIKQSKEELMKSFAVWSGKKLRTEIYPVYRPIEEKREKRLKK